MLFNIILAVDSILLIVFAIYNIILLVQNRSLKQKFDEIKYWISAIDCSAISTSQDKRYLAEATKILEDN